MSNKFRSYSFVLLESDGKTCDYENLVGDYEKLVSFYVIYVEDVRAQSSKSHGN